MSKEGGKQWYSAYLRSEHWVAKRDAAVERSGYKCEECGESGRRDLLGRWLGLHVHHLTYDRIWGERPDDLRVLCVACHKAAHGEAIPGRREEVRLIILARIAALWEPPYGWHNDIQDELDYVDGLIEQGYDL